MRFIWFVYCWENAKREYRHSPTFSSPKFWENQWIQSCHWIVLYCQHAKGQRLLHLPCIVGAAKGLLPSASLMQRLLQWLMLLLYGLVSFGLATATPPPSLVDCAITIIDWSVGGFAKQCLLVTDIVLDQHRGVLCMRTSGISCEVLDFLIKPFDLRTSFTTNLTRNRWRKKYWVSQIRKELENISQVKPCSRNVCPK